MSKLIDSIVNKNFVECDSILSETVELIMARKLEEAKKLTAAKMCEEPHSMNRSASKLRAMDIAELDVSKEKPGDIEDKRGERAVNTSMKTNFGGNQEVASGKTDLPKKQTVNATEKGDLKEEEQIEEARINIVKARIRGGQIQLRNKISYVPGMKLLGGKLQRMSAAERRRRKMGARKAVRKRAPKMNRALMKRQRSLRKRKALGI
jgi:hypothetical protein